MKIKLDLHIKPAPPHLNGPYWRQCYRAGYQWGITHHLASIAHAEHHRDIVIGYKNKDAWLAGFTAGRANHYATKKG